MVKNTTGGTGTKSLARKHQADSNGGRLRLPECDLEKFGIVNKMLGNGMCEIYTNDNVRLIGHIRNKFRGKQKRHNMLTLQSIVLVGLREWENPYKNCDILTMYENIQIEQLRTMPGVRINKLIEIQLGSSNNKSTLDNDIHFTEDIEEVKEIMPQTIPIEEFYIERADEINIDDI
jgi:initiation factor 1A